MLKMVDKTANVAKSSVRICNVLLLDYLLALKNSQNNVNKYFLLIKWFFKLFEAININNKLYFNFYAMYLCCIIRQKTQKSISK